MHEYDYCILSFKFISIKIFAIFLSFKSQGDSWFYFLFLFISIFLPPFFSYPLTPPPLISDLSSWRYMNLLIFLKVQVMSFMILYYMPIFSYIEYFNFCSVLSISRFPLWFILWPMVYLAGIFNCTCIWVLGYLFWLSYISVLK